MKTEKIIINQTEFDGGVLYNWKAEEKVERKTVGASNITIKRGGD